MITTPHRRHRPGRRPSHQQGLTPVWRRLWVLLATVVGVAAMTVASASVASAHVLPTSTVQLSVHEGAVDATVAIPVSDVATATALDLGDGSQAEVDAQAAAITDYLLGHFIPSSGDGQPWRVTIGALVVSEAGDAATTGRYSLLTTTATLVPADGGEVADFDLGYTAIVDKIATHTVIVTVSSDDTHPDSGAVHVGVIKRDTVTNTVSTLTIRTLDQGYQGFASMIALGLRHIAEGTDHQLFLLTLLLPAPLIASDRRWRGFAAVRLTVRRIATVTLAFTLGHSFTLAFGAFSVFVPQSLIEALIAVSILVAAGHAIRPLFPGREALVAGFFGLIHGLAFSETLRELNLTGGQLVSALLGFNLGIEAMQLLIVGLVLPPLILLARAGRHRNLRLVAAALTAIAALGWLAARLGYPNHVADLADQLGIISIPVVLGLWVSAVVITRRTRSRTGPGLHHHPQPLGT